MELTKDITERIYSLIENARSDGKIRKGVNEVTKSLERGEAKLSISAADSSPAEIVMHLPLLAKEKSIMHVEVPSKAELGAAAGLPVATAAVAVVSADKKMMDTLLKDIKTLLDGEAKPVKKVEKKAEKPAKEDKVEESKAEEKPAKDSKEESSKEEQPADEPKEEAPAEKKVEEPSKEEEKPAKEEQAEEKPAKEEKSE